MLNPREYVAEVFRKREYKEKLDAVKNLVSRKANDLEGVKILDIDNHTGLVKKLDIEIREDQEDIQEMERALQEYLREFNHCRVTE